MAAPQSPALNDRWQSTVDSEERQKQRVLELEQQQRQEEVRRELNRVLPVDHHSSTSFRADQNGPIPATNNRSEEESRNRYREETSAARTQPAPLPTPPQSPNSSTFEGLPIRTSDEDELARCQAKILELQVEVNSLESELREREARIEILQSEQREASRLHRQSIRTATDDEIRKLKKQRDDLDKLTEEQEKTIEHLRNELRETKTRKSEVEDQLAEARSTIQRWDRRIESMQRSVDASPAQPHPGSSTKVKESRVQYQGLAFNCPRGERRSGLGTAKDTLERQKCPSNVRKYVR